MCRIRHTLTNPQTAFAPTPWGEDYSAPAESPARNAWGVHGGSNAASVMAGNHALLIIQGHDDADAKLVLAVEEWSCRRDGRSIDLHMRTDALLAAWRSTPQYGKKEKEPLAA